MNRESNRTTSTLDMVLLFSMPVAIVLICVALWYFGVQFNEANAAASAP